MALRKSSRKLKARLAAKRKVLSRKKAKRLVLPAKIGGFVETEYPDGYLGEERICEKFRDSSQGEKLTFDLGFDDPD